MRADEHGNGATAGLLRLGAVEVVPDASAVTGALPLVLESVGGTTLSAALAATAPGGTVVLFWTSSGDKTPTDV